MTTTVIDNDLSISSEMDFEPECDHMQHEALGHGSATLIVHKVVCCDCRPPIRFWCQDCLQASLTKTRAYNLIFCGSCHALYPPEIHCLRDLIISWEPIKK